MKKCIYLPYTPSVADLGFGPSRFVLSDKEGEPNNVGVQNDQKKIDGVIDGSQVSDAAVALSDMPNSAVQPIDMGTLQHHESVPIDGDDDENKGTCPTGGCSNSTKTYKDIYNDRFETAVKKAKADNPNFDIKDRVQWRGIHMTVVKSMRPEVRHNREYLKADKEGPAFANGPEFTILPDGRIFYPKFGEKGKTLQEMYEDQKRLRPHEYSAKEHATMTMMEEAFRNGATKVSHVSHNKDERGNEAIRDQVTMVWDPDTQKGRMEIRNIAMDGNFHSVESAMKIIGQNSDRMIAVRPAEGVGIFVDKSVSIKQIESVVAAYGIEDASRNSIASERAYENLHDDTQRTEVSEAVIDGVVDTAEYVSNRVHEEMKVIGKNIQHLIVDEVENKRLFIPPFLQRLLGVSGQSSNSNLSVEEMLVNSIDLPEVIIVEDKKLKLYEDAENGVVIAAETGVGIGGAIFLLDQIIREGQIGDSEEEITISQSNDLELESESVVTSEALHDAVITFFESNEPPIVIENTIDLLESIQVGEVQTEPVLEKEQVDVEALGRIKDIITVINEAPVEQAITVIEHEEEVVIIQMSEVWDVFIQMSEESRLKSATTNSNSEIYFASESERVQNEEPAHVEQFSLLVTMWLLLKLDSYRQSLETLKSAVLGKNESKTLLESLKDAMPTKLIPKEPTPWILLGILWHLTKTREAAMQNTQQNSSTTQTSSPDPISESPATLHIVYLYSQV